MIHTLVLQRCSLRLGTTGIQTGITHSSPSHYRGLIERWVPPKLESSAEAESSVSAESRVGASLWAMKRMAREVAASQCAEEREQIKR